MATETKPNPLAQWGPIGAPALGGILLVVFIAVVYFGGDISGEQAKLDKTVRDVNTRRSSDKALLPATTLPSVTSVVKMVSPAEREPYKAIEGETKLANLPVFVKVTVQDRVQNEFEEYDTDEPKDGRWSEREFKVTPYAGGSGQVRDFKNWDRDKSGYIERKEYDDPPVEEEERFRQLDKSDDKVLTAPDEISSADMLAWDEDFDDKITLQEFKDRYKAKEWVDLGPVKSVGVSADLEKMEIVVTWETPEVTTVPPDITYRIERYSPETVEQRRKDYGKAVGRYTDALQKWEAAFDKWWLLPTEDDKDAPERTNKAAEPNRRAAMDIFAKVTPRPVKPEEPSDWEVLGVEATGNEYRDLSFETDATYTYAVRAVTGKKLKRGQKPDLVWKNNGDKLCSVAVVQPTHPVRVPNRIVMSWNGTAGGTAVNVTLSKWLRYGTSNADFAWYKVSIVESVDSNTSPNLGGEYTATQISKDRQGKAFKAGDTTPADIGTLLPSGTKMDFRTGFRFVTNTGVGAIFNHQELGDYELPKASKAPMPAQPAPSTTATLEVRALATTAWLKTPMDVTFETTRWHQVEGKWYRVVLIRKRVKIGDEAGGTVDLNNPGEGVTVYDPTGAVMTSAQVKAIKVGTVDMMVGKFEGGIGSSAEERATVKVGGEKFDLFGTLYK